ncbi:MAG: hypothetical protein WBV94_10010 [Blastocatellia bacterium]
MADESDELKEKISQMSDGELLRIVGPDRNDYVEEAIEFAVRELKIRSIPFDEKSEASAASTDEESLEQSAIIIPPCYICGGPMRSGSLIADNELTIFLPDSDEERFVQAFACGNCGQVRLVVDFETDVERED